MRESTWLLKSKTARITYLLVISVHWCLAWVETSHPAVSKCWFVWSSEAGSRGGKTPDWWLGCGAADSWPPHVSFVSAPPYIRYYFSFWLGSSTPHTAVQVAANTEIFGSCENRRTIRCIYICVELLFHTTKASIPHHTTHFMQGDPYDRSSTFYMFYIQIRRI